MYYFFLQLIFSFFSPLPVIVKSMKQNLYISKPYYSTQILPLSWPLVISRFHYGLALERDCDLNISFPTGEPKDRSMAILVL